MEKDVSVVRKLDKLGRITLAKEMRTMLDIPSKTPIEIFVDGDRIVLKKYKPYCTICNEAGEYRTYLNKKMCLKCIYEFNQLAKLNNEDSK